MELKAMELPLTGFGAAATPARVEILTLSPVDRIKRAALIFGAALLGAAIAIPIPLVHFVLVPAALILGAAFASCGCVREKSSGRRGAAAPSALRNRASR